MKTVGRPTRTLLSPREALDKAASLIREANRLAPVAKPRGFVFKAKSFEIYAAWKQRQTNPRLW